VIPISDDSEVKRKRCGACGQELLLSAFYVNRTTRIGRRWDCKECHAQARARRYKTNPAIKASSIARNEKRRKSSPEFREKRNAAARERRKKRKAENLASQSENLTKTK
jgi:hypothetical protein